LNCSKLFGGRQSVNEKGKGGARQGRPGRKNKLRNGGKRLEKNLKPSPNMWEKAVIRNKKRN